MGMYKGKYADAAQVKDVLHRANMLQVPLEDYIERIIEPYTIGGVRGFGFVCKNFNQLEMIVFESLRRFVRDDGADTLGSVMGAGAFADGYAFSFREKNAYNSLHLELGNPLCDAHIDSYSITPEEGGGLWGAYRPTRFLAHGGYDLALSYLAEKRSLRPAMKKISPVLTHLKLDLKVKGVNISGGDDDSLPPLKEVDFDGGARNKITLWVKWTF